MSNAKENLLKYWREELKYFKLIEECPHLNAGYFVRIYQKNEIQIVVEYEINQPKRIYIGYMVDCSYEEASMKYESYFHLGNKRCHVSHREDGKATFQFDDNFSSGYFALHGKHITSANFNKFIKIKENKNQLRDKINKL